MKIKTSYKNIICVCGIMKLFRAKISVVQSVDFVAVLLEYFG